MKKPPFDEFKDSVNELSAKAKQSGDPAAQQLAKVMEDFVEGYEAACDKATQQLLNKQNLERQTRNF